MESHSSDRDLSSPERSKRRLSEHPSSRPGSSGKRPRPSIQKDATKDVKSDSRTPLLHSRHTSSLHSSSGPSSSSSRQNGADLSFRPYNPSTAKSPSDSGSENTAMVEETPRRRRGSRSSRRISDAPPPSTTNSGPPPPRSIPQHPGLGPRRISDNNFGPSQYDRSQPYPAHSSSTSSSSSSHQFRQPLVIDSSEERVHSPPPNLTLSTGQPLVNPPLKTQAAFVGKLFSMLEDEDIRKTGLIHWSSSGSTFTCPNPTEFAKTVLPRFFKHNNWQSFVRQLNMYSFNKVNDLYATSTDPMAWEFRHPLFRQGESHLLASIKRKTTRPNHAEGSQVQSPSDEMNESASRPVAGWMHDQDSEPRPNTSPLPLAPTSTLPAITMPITQAQPLPTRSEVFGYNLKTGEMIPSRPYEASTRAGPRIPYSADIGRLNEARGTSSAASATISIPQSARAGKRTHPDPDYSASAHPPLAHPSRGGSGRGNDRHQTPSLTTGPYSDAPLYPQPTHPSPSPIMALTSQVAYLEERIARLSETLSVERVENVRTHMDLLSYVASITLWLPDAPPQDISALQEALNRRTAELRHKYDALVAVDTLAHLASRNEGANSSRRLSPEIHNRSIQLPQIPSVHSQAYGIAPASQHPHLPRPQYDTPLTSPRLPIVPRPVLSRASTAGGPPGLDGTYANPSVLPLPLPNPVTSALSCDQPAFSRSPLLRRPASSTNVSLLALNRSPAPVDAGRRLSLVGSPKISTVGIDGEEKRMDGEAGSDRPPSGIRDLLN